MKRSTQKGKAIKVKNKCEKCKELEVKIAEIENDSLKKDLRFMNDCREYDRLKLDTAVTFLLKAAAIMERGESGKGLAAQIRKKYYCYGARATNETL